MNFYTQNFEAICPVNGKPVAYTLVIETARVIRVEDIQAEFPAGLEALHEDLADNLHKKWGGVQTLEAMHHGTHIRTVRP